MQSFYFVVAVVGLSGEEYLFLLRKLNVIIITQHLWEQNSHWMLRVEPLLAYVSRSQTKFRSPAALVKDKRGEILFGIIRVDDAWMAL